MSSSSKSLLRVGLIAVAMSWASANQVFAQFDRGAAYECVETLASDEVVFSIFKIDTPTDADLEKAHDVREYFKLGVRNYERFVEDGMDADSLVEKMLARWDNLEKDGNALAPLGITVTKQCLLGAR